MKYFILTLDENYTAPAIIGGNMLRDREIDPAKWYQLPKYMSFLIKHNMQSVFTDVIFQPNFMVSEVVKQTLLLYQPSLRFGRIIVADHERKISRRYYLPILEEIDCLTENSRFNADRSVVYHAQIDPDKVGERKLFCAAGLNCKCILIRMDLAESLLRRSAIGIGLKEVSEIEGDRENM